MMFGHTRFAVRAALFAMLVLLLVGCSNDTDENASPEDVDAKRHRRPPVEEPVEEPVEPVEPVNPSSLLSRNPSSLFRGTREPVEPVEAMLDSSRTRPVEPVEEPVEPVGRGTRRAC